MGLLGLLQRQRYLFYLFTYIPCSLIRVCYGLSGYKILLNRPFLYTPLHRVKSQKISARNTVEFTPSEQDDLFPGLTLREKENFSPDHPSYTSPYAFME
jgi:hypothetical protein